MVGHLGSIFFTVVLKCFQVTSVLLSAEASLRSNCIAADSIFEWEGNMKMINIDLSNKVLSWPL
jgi:hypothetical protein